MTREAGGREGVSRWRQNRVLRRGWGAKVSENFTHAHIAGDQSASKSLMRRDSSKLAQDLLDMAYGESQFSV